MPSFVLTGVYAVVMCVGQLPGDKILSINTRAVIYTKVIIPNFYTFDNHVKLFHINIYNSYFSTDMLTKIMFAKLHRTHTLILRNDSIKLIRSKSFDDMSELMALDVSGNVIHYVHEFSLHGLCSISHLDPGAPNRGGLGGLNPPEFWMGGG